MSLFLQPSLRTCGGSHRWLRDHHPLMPCVLRRVGVAYRRIKAGGISEWPDDNHRLQPTFATKSALFGHAEVVAVCPLLGAERKTYARIEFSGFDPTRTSTAFVTEALPKCPRARYEL